MKYPNKEDIYGLCANPDYYAENMSLAEIDHVIFGFITVRNDKQRWSK
jgi:GH18 family chitinase